MYWNTEGSASAGFPKNVLVCLGAIGSWPIWIKTLAYSIGWVREVRLARKANPCQWDLPNWFWSSEAGLEPNDFDRAILQGFSGYSVTLVTVFETIFLMKQVPDPAKQVEFRLSSSILNQLRKVNSEPATLPNRADSLTVIKEFKSSYSVSLNSMTKNK